MTIAWDTKPWTAKKHLIESFEMDPNGPKRWTKTKQYYFKCLLENCRAKQAFWNHMQKPLIIFLILCIGKGIKRDDKCSAT